MTFYSKETAMAAWNRRADGWISVEDRMPESGVDVNVCCQVKILGFCSNSYVCEAIYAKPKAIPAYDNEGAEYDEKTDEYYLPEGWYERVHNADDYNSIPIPDFVTHWMPRPEPPGKEETK